MTTDTIPTIENGSAPAVEVISTNQILYDIAVAVICQQIKRVAVELGTYSYQVYTYHDTAVDLVYDQESNDIRATLHQPIGKNPTTVVFDVCMKLYRGSTDYHMRTGRPGAWLDHLRRLWVRAETIVKDRASTEAMVEESRFAPVDDERLFLMAPQLIESKPRSSLAEQLVSLLREITRQGYEE